MVAAHRPRRSTLWVGVAGIAAVLGAGAMGGMARVVKGIKVVMTTMAIEERIEETSPSVRGRAIPIRSGDSPAMVAFDYGYAVDWDTNTVTYHSPGQVYVLDARTGELLSTRAYRGTERQWRGDRAWAAAERERWSTLQDVLDGPFFQGAPHLPESLRAAATEYRALFARSVEPELYAHYLELAPEWFAWVGIEAPAP